MQIEKLLEEYRKLRNRLLFQKCNNKQKEILFVNAVTVIKKFDQEILVRTEQEDLDEDFLKSCIEKLKKFLSTFKQEETS